MRRVKLQITTASDGSATAYSPRCTGKVHSLHYVKNNFDDGVDFAVTNETTGENLWTEANVNASAVRYPRQATHSNAGVAALYAAAGTAVQVAAPLANDRIKCVIAQGGNAKLGTLYAYIDK